MRALQCAQILIPIVLTLAAGALASNVATVKPEDVGLNPQRLDQLSHTLQTHVDRGQIAGVLALVGRRGHVAYCETFGYMDVEAARPMQADSIFRIASMTRAVTAVAVLQLMEQGRFMLDNPVSKHIPAFKDMTVAVDPSEIVPAERPITIRDLLRHTSGILYGGKACRQAKLHQWGRSLSAFVETLCALPFGSQPGGQFKYSYSTDVLGYVVEVVSDRPLDDYFEQFIFKPLAVHDTGFAVPREKVERLTNHYHYTQGKLECRERAATSPFLKRAKALSEGSGSSYSYPGLVTTARDWWRFMEMLRNQGQLDGKRVLSHPAAQVMCADHLGDIPGASSPGPGMTCPSASLRTPLSTADSPRRGQFVGRAVRTTRTIL